MKENINNNNNIVYNEAKIKEAQDLLNEIKNDLSDADNTLYDAVMKISRARGIETVEVDDTAIDMRMPEKLMIQCREDTKTITDTLDNQVHAIESFFGREEVKADGDISSNVQYRKEGISGVTAEQGESTNFYYDKNGNKVILDENGKIISSNTTVPATVQTVPETAAPTTVPSTLPTNPPTTTETTLPPPTTAPTTVTTPPPTTTKTTTAPTTSTTPKSTPKLETVPDTKGGRSARSIPNNQVVYAGPGYFENKDTPPDLPEIKTSPATHMLLYGGPNMPTDPIVTAPPSDPLLIQALYSAPPEYRTDNITNPPITTPTSPILDDKKGDYLGTIIINNNTQPVPSNPVTDTNIVNTTSAIQERVSDTVLSQHASPVSSNLDGAVDNSSTTGYTDSTPQYSSIPETGVGMKDSFGDYITPAAIGAAAGIAGMIAAKAMRKDKKEEEENE